MAEPMNALTRRLFRATPRAGRGEPGWVSGRATEPLTGAELVWHWRIEHGRIGEARYQVRGCPHLIAAAALAAERLEGQPGAGPALDLKAIIKDLEAPAGKLGRLFLIEDAMDCAALQVRCAPI